MIDITVIIFLVIIGNKSFIEWKEYGSSILLTEVKINEEHLVLKSFAFKATLLRNYKLSYTYTYILKTPIFHLKLYHRCKISNYRRKRPNYWRIFQRFWKSSFSFETPSSFYDKIFFFILKNMASWLYCTTLIFS